MSGLGLGMMAKGMAPRAPSNTEIGVFHKRLCTCLYSEPVARQEQSCGVAPVEVCDADALSNPTHVSHVPDVKPLRGVV